MWNSPLKKPLGFPLGRPMQLSNAGNGGILVAPALVGSGDGSVLVSGAAALQAMAMLGEGTGTVPETDPTLLAWFRADQGVTQVNSFLAESDFTSASWSKSNLTVTANNTTDPDGGTAADLLTDDATSGAHGVIQSAGTTGFVAILRVRAKMNTRRYLAVLANGGLIIRWFDLQLGALGSLTDGSGNHLESTIEDLGSGWFLCTVRFNMTNAQSQLRLAPGDGGATTYSGSGDSLWVYKAELLQRTSAWADQTSNLNDVSNAVTVTSPFYSSTNWNGSQPGLDFVAASSLNLKNTASPAAAALAGVSKPFTIYGVVDREASTAAAIPMGLGGESGNTSVIYAEFLGGGGMRLRLRDDANITSTVSQSGGPTSGLIWFAMVRDATFANSKLWINGADCTGVISGTATGTASLTQLCLGSSHTNLNYFDGDSAEFRIYSEAHDAARIASIGAELTSRWGGL